MKIYDISQEIFSCQVYTGDPAPQKEIICSINNGDLYNLTAFSMCAHNGTHIDAPCHFLKDGKTVADIPLTKFIGMAFVAEHNGILSGADAQEILDNANLVNTDCAKRILLKGDCTVSAQAATVFAQNGIWLLGVESQTVGPADAPMEVHKILLTAEVVLLEGIRLFNVNTGAYFLSAQPLNLDGADGAPTRAVLIDFNTNP